MSAEILLGLLLLICWAGNLFFNKINHRRGIQLTKPLLMPLLLCLYLLTAKVPEYLLILALVCSFIGDVCLLWVEKKVLFIGGLVAFLLGHIFYSIVFLDSTHFLIILPQWFFLLFIPYGAYAIFVFSKLADYVGEMRIPVLIYMGVIIFMSFASLTRVWVHSGAAFFAPFLGSLLFVSSDTLLALREFRGKIKDANVWIMATYVLAQCLIVFGLGSKF